jgi:hydroxyethylthiazole kinase-like uncharacterized protein yjeF
LIVGGNARFGGAAILSASAAVYAGGGLVSVATDRVNRDALHARLPEAMIIPYDDPAYIQLLATMDVIVIGPGLGTEAFALQLLTATFAAIRPQQTLIIDGSAITLVAQHQLTLPKAQLVWTPHQMEWQRLSGIAIAEQTPAANQFAAAKLPGTVIVKSHRTEIFTPTDAYQNPVGSAAMATGGSGDTLTGIIAAFIGQFGYHEPPFTPIVRLRTQLRPPIMSLYPAWSSQNYRGIWPRSQRYHWMNRLGTDGRSESLTEEQKKQAAQTQSSRLCRLFLLIYLRNAALSAAVNRR